MLLLFALFHHCHFSVNFNPYTLRIQPYVGVLKVMQNTEQNDKQNTNEAPGNIPVLAFNNIFDILQYPFVENENGKL